MSTAVVALPNILDPMYWLGANGVFASAVLPDILIIVFVETGLLFPLLPGESLLFTGGLLASHRNHRSASGYWHPAVAVVAVLGDQTGYFIGRRIGPALFKKEDSRFFKQHYVTESHAFFEKYGPWAIILARFAPFVRTFVPVVAGVSYMRYPVFLGFDIVGGIALGRRRDGSGLLLGQCAVRAPQPGNDHPGDPVRIAVAGADLGRSRLPVAAPAPPRTAPPSKARKSLIRRRYRTKPAATS